LTRNRHRTILVLSKQSNTGNKAMTATATATVTTPANTDNSIKAAALALLNGSDKAPNLRAIADSKGDVYNVNPYLLEDSGKNFRNLTTPAAKAKLYELARQIKAQGVLEPLTAYHENGKNVVSNGHRRLAATKIAIEELGAEVLTVPVRIAPRGSNDADHQFDQFIRNSGEAPTALETANLFKNQLALGWTEDKLAEKSGMDKPTITRYLDIAALPAELHGMIEREEVSASFALQRHKVNRENGTVTVAELKKTLEIAKVEGKDKATAAYLPAQAPVTAGLRKTRTPRPRVGDAPVRVTDKDILHIFSRLMRNVDLTKYERDGSDVEFTGKLSQEDYIKVRDHYRL
jgi:ParB-like chromosome segregation protein Spo0J